MSDESQNGVGEKKMTEKRQKNDKKDRQEVPGTFRKRTTSLYGGGGKGGRTKKSGEKKTAGIGQGEG